MAVPAPFYNAIKGTTAGTPGTGAFTPNAASTGFRAWSLVPTGWIGLVRYEDGASWELTYSYWSGTTLSRASTQLFDSSSGSALSLTSSATAALVIDASDIMSHIGTTPWCGWFSAVGTGTITGIAIVTPTSVGTAAGVNLASTNYLTQQPRAQYTSLTTANAQAGWNSIASCVIVSTTAGQAGFEITMRFGASQLPTGPRLFAGLTSSSFNGNAGEPSAFTAHYATFAKDSTDTNIQLLVNSNVSTGTKTDTGIPLVANGWYEMCIWCEPGNNKIYGLLIRLDTGAIWFGTTTTDVPATGAIMSPFLIGGLSSTTGTAFIMQAGSMVIRGGQ